MIKVENLTKRYAGFTAVDDLSFEVGKVFSSRCHELSGVCAVVGVREEDWAQSV